MNEFLIIGVTLLFSAFFSGIEIAFISANRLHIEVLSQKGALTGQILSKFTANQSQFLGTTLVGNNLSLVIYGYFMARMIEPTLMEVIPEGGRTIILVTQTLISTTVVLLTAEFLPKSLFLMNADRFLQVLSVPMLIIYYLMYPVTRAVVGLSRLVISKLMDYEFSEDKPVFGLTDLNNYIKRNLRQNKIDEGEVDARILNNAIEFKTVKVRECMIPRTEIVAVEVSEEVRVLKEAFIESGHSKIIIYKETIDDVVGYCHSLEMFKKPSDIKSIITPIIIVPETTPASELLIQFITERKSLAWVVDEYGGTSGIVSMEDVIEEIFGEIQDEHDDEDLMENQLDDHTFILSARHEVDYLNEKYAFQLPEGEYDTLGGLILNFKEDIPLVNEDISIDHFLITILSVEENRIDTVRLKVMPMTEEAISN